MSLSQRLFGHAFEATRVFGDRRWDVALGTFSLLAKLFPQASWIKRDQARAFLGKEDWEKAEAVLKQAIALDPQDAEIHQALAECYVNQGRWDEALLACDRVLALVPDSPWFYQLKGRIHLGQEDYPAAIRAFETALGRDETVSWFHFQLGEALLKAGQVEAAIPRLRRSLDLNPGFPWASYHLGLALLNQNDFEGAIAIFEAAQRQAPEEAVMFGDCCQYAQHLQRQDRRIQDYCQARQAEKQAIGKEPNPQDQNRNRPLDVLLVTPYPTYPPKLGAITRMFQEARGLGKQHRLVVASIIFDAKGFSIVDDMASYCALPLVALVGDTDPQSAGQPNLIRKYSSQRLTYMLKQLQAVDFDIVCFDFIYMAQYRHLFPHAYSVVCEHNIESELLKRFAALQSGQGEVDKLKGQTEALEAFDNADSEAIKLAAYEAEHWPQFNLRTTVSELDRAVLLSRCPGLETWVVNNGIDTEATPLLNNWESRKIFFFGTLTYFPNIDGATYFAKEVMPLIWQAAPDLTFCIAGADPPETVLALAKDPRIEVVANPEFMETVAKDCHISVVPLRVGSGTRIKILHAMAMGLPVVSTSLGCEGLAGVDGEHLLIRDRPEDLAEAVLALDRDRLLWKNLRVNGRRLVEATYDWQAIYADFESRLFEAWRASKTEESKTLRSTTAESHA